MHKGGNMVKRIYLTPKDLAQLAGVSLRTAQTLYNKVKAARKKTKFITLTDWAKYNGDSEAEIKKTLKLK